MNTTPTLRSESYALPNFQYSNYNRSSLDVQASAGISLVTADGDKVTISANSSTQASLETYNYLGQIQGQTVAIHGEEFQLSTSSGFALTVDGTLDQEELVDIKKLLNTLASVSKDFLSGNTGNGLQHIAQLNNLDSIASFETSFSFTRQASSLTASQISSPAGSQPVDSPDDAAATPPSNIQAADSFIEQLAKAAKKLQGNENDEKIPKRFAQLFKKLAYHLPLDNNEEKLAERIQSEHSKRDRGHHNDGEAQAVS